MMRHNEETINFEKSILAACLMGAYTEVIASLQPKDFIDTHNRLIFRAICSIDDSDEPVDIVNVTRWLKKRGMKKAGTILSKILDVPVPTDMDFYISQVKNNALRLNLSAGIKKLSRICDDRSMDYDSMVDAVQSEILGVIEFGGQSSKAVEYKELCTDIVEVWEKVGSGDKSNGYETGFRGLDEVIGGLYPGDLIVLAARPGMGKTTFALNLVDYVATQSVPVYFVSLEMTKGDIIAKHTAKHAMVNSRKFRFGGFTSDEWGRINEALGKLYEMPIVIDDTADDNFMTILRKIKYNCHRYGAKVAVIDYLQLISGDDRIKRNEMIGKISRGLKQVAKDCEVAMILISQLNRRVEMREDKRPMLSDLRDSGNIEQDADIVLMLYRDSYYDLEAEDPQRTELFVAKHRHGEDRKVVELRYIAWRATFEDWES